MFIICYVCTLHATAISDTVTDPLPVWDTVDHFILVQTLSLTASSDNVAGLIPVCVLSITTNWDTVGDYILALTLSTTVNSDIATFTLLPVCTLSPTVNSDIAIDVPFWSFIFAKAGKHGL